MNTIYFIGFGNVTPKTDHGKLATICYTMIGIPLMILYLSVVGNLLANAFRKIYGRFCSCWSSGSSSSSTSSYSSGSSSPTTGSPSHPHRYHSSSSSMHHHLSDNQKASETEMMLLKSRSLDRRSQRMLSGSVAGLASGMPAMTVANWSDPNPYITANGHIPSMGSVNCCFVSFNGFIAVYIVLFSVLFSCVLSLYLNQDVILYQPWKNAFTVKGTFECFCITSLFLQAIVFQDYSSSVGCLMFSFSVDFIVTLLLPFFFCLSLSLCHFHCVSLLFTLFNPSKFAASCFCIESFPRRQINSGHSLLLQLDFCCCVKRQGKQEIKLMNFLNEKMRKKKRVEKGIQNKEEKKNLRRKSNERRFKRKREVSDA